MPVRKAARPKCMPLDPAIRVLSRSKKAADRAMPARLSIIAFCLRLQKACATMRPMSTITPPRSAAILDRIEDAFELSNTQLAGLFGVRRQALDGWRERGVPGARLEKATTVAEIADLLSHRLKPERVPGVARRPAATYAGLTMLEMISRDRHRELLESVRQTFDWSSAS